MAYEDQQPEFPVGDNSKKSSRFLPRYFRTSTNEKLTSSTIDQLFSSGAVEKINAFVACSQPHEKHSPIFMICNDCEQVAETSIKPQGSSLDRTARAIGFDIQHTVVEAEGLCAACRERAPL